MLELDQPLAPPIDLGPPLVDEEIAGQSRQALEQLQTVAATIPAAPPVNPLEEMVREMIRPMLKQWLDEHLPQMVEEHVKREISGSRDGRSEVLAQAGRLALLRLVGRNRDPATPAS